MLNPRVVSFLRFAALAAALPLAALLSPGCASFPTVDQDRPASSAVPASTATRLGALAAARPADASADSGFVLLDEGWDALAERLALADLADSTLDLQYFIWHPDDAGVLIAERALRAAERGVRVRVLLDDVAMEVRTRRLANLDAHSNVEIRVYNPSGITYEHHYQRTAQMARDFGKMNRRMHNKMFAVDGCFAVVGGRNIGDEYFDLSHERNFRDRDVLAVGGIVTNIANTFDDFWNSPWAVELPKIARMDVSAAALDRYATRLHERAARIAEERTGLEEHVQLMRSRLTNVWSEAHLGTAEVVCDIPGKNVERAGDLKGYGESGERLTQLALETEKELLVQTPWVFFMPGTFDLMNKLKARGAKVKIISTSLAAGIKTPVFSEYVKQRARILETGVELYELMPRAKAWDDRVVEHPAAHRPPPVTIHAKTAVFDGKRVYVGSFNLDPRSTHLNTELGLLINAPELAQEIREIMLDEAGPANSWQVKLGPKGEITWVGLKDGQLDVTTRDPGMTWIKRIAFFVIRQMPIEPLL